MNLSDFEEYLAKGIARRITPNKFRAGSLVDDSSKRRKFLEQLTKNVVLIDENANYFIEEVYDVLISLIRARMLLDGFEASGNYSHEAEVSYLKELKFADFEVNLMNELRQFRNGVKYYGKRYNKETAEKILGFLKSFYPKLVELTKK